MLSWVQIPPAAPKTIKIQGGKNMTLRDIAMYRAKAIYSMQSYKGKSLLEWAIIWFKTSNDAFHELYGFNFNPHQYTYLYEIARKEVYGN